jgi:hypothetical protein
MVADADHRHRRDRCQHRTEFRAEPPVKFVFNPQAPRWGPADSSLLAAKLEDKGAGIVPMAGQCLLAKFKTGGGATGTIRPSTSPRMPTSGFEVRGRVVRQRSARFARVRLEVDG